MLRQTWVFASGGICAHVVNSGASGPETLMHYFYATVGSAGHVVHSGASEV
jgi:hypothetical protein